MTGYGQGTARVESVEASIEMRSVNSRFCEVSIRQPRSLNEHELDIQNLVKQTFARGRINVQVQVDTNADVTLPVKVDEKAARAYGLLLESLRLAAGISAPVTVDHLLKFPEVLTSIEDSDEGNAWIWEAVQHALAEAVQALWKMRLQEGEALQRELADRIDRIEEKLNAVDTYAPERIEQARTRLHERLEELMTDERLNPERLELEIAVLADKLDVTEECVRLRSHLVLFREAMQSDEPVGRKLNFLSQEINREVNTIGSKANDATLAHLVVGMKEELEKIREQVENVE